MSAKRIIKATSQDTTQAHGYEPRIIAYLCTWCSYTGADSAGIARLPSPANIRAIRVPCSGRVSPELIMRTFNQGADGVLVLGCHIGECHYDSGNHRTAKRLPVVQSLMAFAGLEPERLRLDWVSASEGERFARITNEFTDSVRALGPARWRVQNDGWQNFKRLAEPPLVRSISSATVAATQPPPDYYRDLTHAIQGSARQLLTSGQVSCVIGYESGTHHRTRPVFIYHPEDVDRLVWNPDCTHNLSLYLRQKLHKGNGHKEPQKPIAVVVKPCDSRAINVLLAENQFSRDQVYLIGVACDGIHEKHNSAELQSRCQACEDLEPVIYDTLIGTPKTRAKGHAWQSDALAQIGAMTALQRAEYWLSQFDRCIRCYACRQACPMCDCPTCLYERDDSVWAGMGLGLDEKRTFHLGRAYHLAGRCVGCNECERACPMEIPISLLNMHLAQEVQAAFGHRAGLNIAPSPFATILDREEA